MEPRSPLKVTVSVTRLQEVFDGALAAKQTATEYEAMRLTAKDIAFREGMALSYAPDLTAWKLVRWVEYDELVLPFGLEEEEEREMILSSLVKRAMQKARGEIRIVRKFESGT